MPRPSQELTLNGINNCDASCVTALCETALINMWNAALDATADANLVGDFPIQISGQAKFDDHAVVTGFEGSWLGHVKSGPDTVLVKGSALATPHKPTPPPAG